MRLYCPILIAVAIAANDPILAADAPSKDDAKQALRKAVRFFHTKVAVGGGYVWQYSGDLKLREGEGKAGDSLIWVQPPGTPTIGEAFLDAHDATSEKEYLDAALDAARALVKGQMRTGGWGYFAEADAEKRKGYRYRDVAEVKTTRWNRATVLDDDTTQAAVRFLVRLDAKLVQSDKAIHDAALFALDQLLVAQYPNGSWFAWWEHDPKPADEKEFPILKASFPDSWPREWEKYPGRYIINDNLMADMIETLLLAGDVYTEKRYVEAAKKAGDFLLLAQLSEPQPAWAQQYNLSMHPCWARKFEPPAVTAGESQGVLETLLLLYRRTGEKKYLEPIPRALAYLKKSRLADGRLARFYELKTNKPLYFTKDYRLTYESNDLPTHYGFIVGSKLDRIEAEYIRLKDADLSKLPPPGKPSARVLAPKVQTIIAALDERGAWIERVSLKAHKGEPASGVIRCRTFADNVRALAQYVAALD